MKSSYNIERLNTVGDWRYDLTAFFHCLTFSEKQEIIEQGLSRGNES